MKERLDLGSRMKAENETGEGVRKSRGEGERGEGKGGEKERGRGGEGERGRGGEGERGRGGEGERGRGGEEERGVQTLLVFYRHMSSHQLRDVSLMGTRSGNFLPC